jgi:hypothetical protein
MSSPQNVQKVERSEKQKDGRHRGHRLGWPRRKSSANEGKDTQGASPNHERKQEFIECPEAEIRDPKNRPGPCGDPSITASVDKKSTETLGQRHAGGRANQSSAIEQDGEIQDAGINREKTVDDPSRKQRQGHGRRGKHSGRQSRGGGGIQNSRAQSPHANVISHYDHTAKLLETRTTELRAAQKFLSIEDRASTSDVVQLVKDLNSHVIQISARLAESLKLQMVLSPDEGGKYEAGQSVAELIGPLAQKMLELFRGQDDRELLDVVFKGCITAWAYKFIEAWQFETSLNVLDGIYDTIYSTGEFS